LDDRPFGAFDPPARYARLLRLAQDAPDNLFGKQLARIARELYLWRAPLPADVTVEELRLRCWLRDNTCERKFVFTPWRFDVAERRAIGKALPRDGVFVDVGANVGIYTLSAARALGGAGRVVAIEPNPPALERLRFNIAATLASARDWPRIDVLACGVSDREGPLELRVDEGNLGGASVMARPARFANGASNAHVTIRCRELLSILGELEIERVDALKIDIEGAEDRALGAFLDRAPDPLLPRCLVIENSDHLWKRDLRESLGMHGYRETMRTRLNTVLERGQIC
jgi:FkbM family methyltransferase